MARLVIVIEVHVDPRLEDPLELAEYLLDSDLEVALVSAEWDGPAPLRTS